MRAIVAMVGSRRGNRRDVSTSLCGPGRSIPAWPRFCCWTDYLSKHHSFLTDPAQRRITSIAGNRVASSQLRERIFLASAGRRAIGSDCGRCDLFFPQWLRLARRLSASTRRAARTLAMTFATSTSPRIAGNASNSLLASGTTAPRGFSGDGSREKSA